MAMSLPSTLHASATTFPNSTLSQPPSEEQPLPPTPISPRFTLELEFVLCLSNPFYLQYLATTYPHLLNPPPASSITTTTISPAIPDDTDAALFSRYLSYLYTYWRTPEYSQYLTHPAAALRNLQLLQSEEFRRDLIRPDIIAKLFDLEGDQSNHNDATGEATKEEQEQEHAGTTNGSFRVVINGGGDG